MPYTAGGSARTNSVTVPSLAELVLCGADGSFLPVSYLLNTLCHEVCSVRSCIRIVSHFRLGVLNTIASHPIRPMILLPSPFVPHARSGGLQRRSLHAPPQPLPDCFPPVLSRTSRLIVTQTSNAYTYNWPLHLPFMSRIAGAYQTHESRLSVSKTVGQASFRSIGSPAKRILW